MAFAAKYDYAQREAIVHAYDELGIRPARRVVTLAARGELPPVRGHRPPPFSVPENTIRSMAREDRRKRAGLVRSTLLAERPRDAVEQLRRRLICAADAQLRDLESAAPGHRDFRKLCQVIRAVREISALPEPSAPRPAAPGAKVNGHRNGGETRSGFAGAILADHRALLYG